MQLVSLWNVVKVDVGVLLLERGQLVEEIVEVSFLDILFFGFLCLIFRFLVILFLILIIFFMLFPDHIDDNLLFVILIIFFVVINIMFLSLDVPFTLRFLVNDLVVIHWFYQLISH